MEVLTTSDCSITTFLQVILSKSEIKQTEGFFKEEAARRVYEEYLEVEGYAFEVKYNAKGNLYINLEYRPAGERKIRARQDSMDMNLYMTDFLKMENVRFLYYKEAITQRMEWKRVL